MIDGIPNRMVATRRGRGRPTLAEVEARPKPAPVDRDLETGAHRCQHCGRVGGLRVYGNHNNVRYMRCALCASCFAYRDDQLQRLR